MTLLFAVIASAVISFLAIRPSEPSYNGRTLSRWLQQYTEYQEYHYPAAQAAAPYILEAQEAIRATGTNAIPVALRWISYEPSLFTLTLIHFMQNFAPVIGTVSMTKRERFVFQAEMVFDILGSDARPAIPELTRLAIESRNETRVFRCARALVAIGPEGVSGLITIISAPNCKARYAAAAVTSGLGSNAAPAIPILLRSASDPDDRLACAASETLGDVALSPSLVIPALTSTLQSTNAYRRASAARGLAGFGVAAKSAAPDLQQALTDPTQIVRQQATNALLRIAPELLTNAPHR